jgi:FtsP/CotA-like multicopper oxidase with cupredoxin domain
MQTRKPWSFFMSLFAALLIAPAESAQYQYPQGSANRHKNLLIWSLSFGLLFALDLRAQDPLMPDPPEVRSPFVLRAINDPETGKAAFSFEGQEDPPVIRAAPGEDIRLTYMNEMSTNSHERCVDEPCMNMTNLHFHGLHVSPNAPQDDVITMMAMPGQSLHYVVNIPLNQPPGLYWYHTHPHGESYRQALDGMSGAIVIDGMERYAPEVRYMRERILVLRDKVIEKNDPATSVLMHRVQMPATGCGTSTEEPERIFTVNRVVRPQIAIAPGERQFWRIVNASPDLYADLQVDTEQLEIVARDGMPIAFHDPKHRSELADHILVPPAGRVEAIVTGPQPGAQASLRTLCFDTGPDGDPNPAMVLADMVDLAQPTHVISTAPVDTRAPIYKPLSPKLITRVENSAADFVVTFTEDKKGFYINGKKYGAMDAPMTSVVIGTYRHWRVVNDTQEVHPFHIHQVHFFVYAQNGERLTRPEWLDTVNVPVKGSVDLMMDFTDPIIRGISLFHCHLLSHEDKGMMAQILFK